jgi:hypothetical protein
MLSFVRRFILLLLIAGLPLQGYAMQIGMVEHQGMHDHVMSVQEPSLDEHGCCPHDMRQHGEPADQSVPQGDCSHCPLCGTSLPVSPTSAAERNSTAILHPATEPAVSDFYPDLPQRPPLSLLS